MAKEKSKEAGAAGRGYNVKGSGRTVQDIEVRKYADGYDPGPERTEDADLIRAFSQLSQAKALEKRAKELTDKAYNILGPNYLVTGMSTLHLPDVGTVEVFQGSQSRLDAARFCELLVAQYGVPADSVAKAREGATKQTANSKLTVKFKPSKRREDV